MSKVFLSASAFLLGAGLWAASASAAPLALKGSMEASGNPGMQSLLVDIADPKPLDQFEAAKKLNLRPLENDGLFRIGNPAKEQRQRAAASASAAARALDANIDLRGQMLYHDAWTDYNWMDFQGFYSLPHSIEDNFYLRGLTGVGLNWGGYYDPETRIFHGVASDWNLSAGTISYCYNVAYDTQTWERVQADVMTNNAMCAFSAAYDPTEGTPYGYFVSPAGQLMWASADYEAGKTYEIESYDFSEFGDRVLYFLACDDEGQFYGLNLDAELVKIDKETGEQTVVGQTTVPVDYKGGCTINNRNHTMLVTTFGLDFDIFNREGTSGIWEVNLETGASEKITSFFGDIWIMNLYIESLAQEKAPNAPELNVTAPEGTMTATYEVKIPTTLFDGTPLTGSVDWILTMDGQAIAEGRNSAGAIATGTVQVTTTGNHTFAAYCYNAEGNSPKATQTIFIGKGLPNAPKNAVLKYEDGTLSLTWDAVTTSSDGGYINPAEVTYTITPLEGEPFEVQTNSWSQQMEAPQFRTVYQYSVKANYAGQTSPEFVSNWIALGAYETPADFNMKMGYNDMAIINYGFTVIDGDGDGDQTGGKWHSGLGGASFKITNARSSQANDYLITPPIWLEEGQVYQMTVPAYTQSATSVSKPQRLRLLAGSEPTIEGLDTELLGETNVCAYEQDGFEMKGLYKAPASGNYYFAVHVNTPRTYAWSYANNTVYIPSISVSGGVDAAAPVAATNVSIIPDATGQLKAVINFTTPTTDVSGNALTGYVPYVVYRDGKQITSNNYTKGGVAKTFTDTTVPEMGTYTYEIVCKYSNKPGIIFKKDVYVGPYPAAAPQNVGIIEAYQPGDVMVFWDPVTTDINKSAMPASNMSYMIYRLETVDGVQNMVPMLSAPTKATHASFTANPDPESQRLVEYFVKASNLGNEGSWTRTPYIAVGNAYKIPVYLSNNADLNNCVVGTGSILGSASFSVFTDGEGIESVDGDNTFFASVSSFTDGRSCFLMTGKIDLADCQRPELTYWTYKLDDSDDNYIQTKVLVDGEWVNASPAPEYGNAYHRDMKAGQWTKVRYDLSAFKGKHIQLRFDAYHYTHGNNLIDNIRIEEMADKDLFVASIEAPATVDPNQEFDINVSLGSIGWQTADGFLLHLYRDGDLFETRELSGLAYNEDMLVSFTDMLTHFDAADPEAVYTAEIEYDGDVDLTNNISSEIVVVRNTTVLPVVEDLAVVQTEDGAHLTWTPYTSESAEPVEYTETFEEQESWAQSMEGWTFIDKDSEPCYTKFSAILSMPFANNSKLSWFIWDQSANSGDTDAKQDYTMPHSGTKCLNQVYSNRYQDDDDDYVNPYVNDWAMSPPLTGKAQTIKFWVKGWSPNEKLEVWYAEEYTDDTTKFTKVTTAGSNGTITATKAWVEYQVELPEGAVRFALRAYYRDDRRMLMIDDVTFTPDLSYGQPVLVGYHIYRNGVKLNDEAVNGNEFVDTNLIDGSHTYHVIGVFDKGLSELSNPARLDYSGLAMVGGDEASVGVDGRYIVVSNAPLLPVAIYTIDGKTIHSGLGDIRKPVLPGIYLVHVGSVTHKLLVR